MKRLPLAAALLISSFGAASAVSAPDVPLPRERPDAVRNRPGPAVPPVPETPTPPAAPSAESLPAAGPPADAGPSECERRLGSVAAFTPLPAVIGPGACGAQDVVRLQGVLMPDNTRVAVDPPATLRCTMAEAVAQWLRADLGPAVAPLGGHLVAMTNYDSFDCRGRNNVAGAKLSEHGKANALDLRALKLSNGVSIAPTDPEVAKDFRDAMRVSACARFKTVLGPGSDGYHEDHIHLDLAERSHGYALCQWDVRMPAIPLPAPRPSAVIDATP